MTKLEPIVDTEIMKLLKEFIPYIQICSDGVDYFNMIMKGGYIPTYGFLVEILLNFALKELDSLFHEDEYPSFFYTRNCHEIIVYTSQKELEFESSFLSLLDSLNLDGKIVSIGPGDPPIPSCINPDCLISISEDGRLIIRKNCE